MPTASKASEKEAQAQEYRERAEADFDPAETARERLERLNAEAKALQAQIDLEEQEKIAKELLPSILKIRDLLEAQNPGKVCRSMTVRLQKPGDVEPGLVAEMEQGKPGVVVKFRMVTPRKAKDSS